MTPYLLDTNIVLHFSRSNSPVAAQVEADYRILSSPWRPMISAVTITDAHLFSRAWPADRKETLHALLRDMIVVPVQRDDVLAALRALREVVPIYRKLDERKGTEPKIRHNAVLVAAAANAVGAAVLTTDTDFLGLPPGCVRVIQVNPETGETETRIG